MVIRKELFIKKPTYEHKNKGINYIFEKE